MKIAVIGIWTLLVCAWCVAEDKPPTLTTQEQQNLQSEAKDVQLLIKDYQILKLQTLLIEKRIQDANAQLAARAQLMLKDKKLDPEKYEVIRDEQTGAFHIRKKSDKE
jgi:hypothetical protein